MDLNAEATLHTLLDLPIAALGTLHQGAPFVSMVPVAPARDRSGFLIHVSRLAQHTGDLLADKRMSLMFLAPLGMDQDPLSLPRVTLQGEAEAILTDSEAYASAAEAYLARFHQAELTLGLGDFPFFRLRPTSGRLVSGFGRALSLDAHQIQAGLSQVT